MKCQIDKVSQGRCYREAVTARSTGKAIVRLCKGHDDANGKTIGHTVEMDAQIEFIIKLRHADGTTPFYAPHCIKQRSSEFPDTKILTNERATINLAVECTHKVEGVSQAEVWRNYGQADEKMIGVAHHTGAFDWNRE